MNTYLSITDVPLILNVEEAGRLLRISKNSVYAAIKNGSIPAIKVGKQIRIYREDLVGLPINSSRQCISPCHHTSHDI